MEGSLNGLFEDDIMEVACTMRDD